MGMTMAHYDYYGVALPVLTDDKMALGCCITMKTMDGNGNIAYEEYKSPGIQAVEALGMLDTFCDSLRMQIMQNARKSS
jgi:hypothetical protein